MKKTILLSTLAVFAALTTAKAQSIENFNLGADFTVSKTTQKTAENKGFCQKGDIDYKGVVECFGVPTYFTPLEESRKVTMTGDRSEPRYAEAKYAKDGKEDTIWFWDNKINGFTLATDRFTALKGIFNGGIKVGDSVDRIKSIAVYYTKNWDTKANRYAYLEKVIDPANDYPEKTNLTLFDAKVDGEIISFRVENGIIKIIQCMEWE